MSRLAKLEFGAARVALRRHGDRVVVAAKGGSSVVDLDIGVVQLRGGGAVGASIGHGRLALHLDVAVLVLRIGAVVVVVQLLGELLQVTLVLGEDGVDGQVDVAVGSDAAELLGNVVDHGLATVVELGLAKVPLLVGPDHLVKLVDGGDEGELGVFENLCVSVCDTRVSQVGG